MADKVEPKAGTEEATPGGASGTATKNESEVDTARQKMPIGEGKGLTQLSPFRQTEPGVIPQRPYKALEDYDFETFDFLKGRDITLKDGVITIEADSRDEALQVASNVVAVVSGGLESLASYQTDDDGHWLISLRRKES